MREILEKIFLSGNEDFDNEHIRPRINDALSAIVEEIRKEMPQKKKSKVFRILPPLFEGYNQAITDMHTALEKIEKGDNLSKGEGKIK